MPSEGEHVISVCATGISGRKAVLLRLRQRLVDVAAPGGDAYDTADGDLDVTQRRCSPAYPKALAEARGELNADGTPNVPSVVRDCDATALRLLPVPAGHLDGRAARRRRGRAHRQPVRAPRPAPGGLTLDPDVVERIMQVDGDQDSPARRRAPSPTPAGPAAGRHVTSVTTTHTCEGTAASQRLLRRGRRGRPGRRPRPAVTALRHTPPRSRPDRSRPHPGAARQAPRAPRSHGAPPGGRRAPPRRPPAVPGAPGVRRRPG